MKLFGRNLNNDVAIVAEIGLNHDGSLNKALKLVKLAAEAGFDAVKFQVFNPYRFVSTDNSKRFERIEKLNLTDEEYLVIKKYTKKLGIFMLGSAISEDKVKLCSKFGKAIKVASGDINFYPTIDQIIKKKKILLLSSGNSTLSEINETINYVKKKLTKKNIRNKLIILHCVSSYPTPNNQSNVKKILFLKKKFKSINIGYSNHCVAPEPVLAAVCFGASLIEVHITSSKRGKKFRDHLLSFDKKNMKNLVKSIRIIKDTIKISSIRPMKCEERVQLMRKGLIASQNIKKGSRLKFSDIMFARPSIYFLAKDKKKLIGKKVNIDLKQGQLIKKIHFN